MPSTNPRPVDEATVAFYDSNAAAYAAWTGNDRDTRFRDRMIGRLPGGGSVLDLGCGAGWDSAAFVAAGFHVVAVDASRELAREARKTHGLDVRVMSFDQIRETDAFDGIWASYSLQHVPRAGLPAVIGNISRALKPAGWLYIGVQKGGDTRRDRLGRLYCHHRTDDLEAMLSNAGFGEFTSEVAVGTGYDGSRCELLNLEAKRIA
ncbi:MAG: class I SAM-dependent methyltransferase [Rhodobacteraceae bacterium]|nr:class I SAM-dependent methyltransferase [Paracoccaceae bacterium]MCY4140824.1 class I SAM-dependent methyltransferase [Paracoccaceae bacterium]